MIMSVFHYLNKKFVSVSVKANSVCWVSGIQKSAHSPASVTMLLDRFSTSPFLSNHLTQFTGSMCRLVFSYFDEHDCIVRALYPVDMPLSTGAYSFSFSVFLWCVLRVFCVWCVSPVWCVFQGYEWLDPFIPVHVPNYSEKEAYSCLEYYLDRNWIQHEGGWCSSADVTLQPMVQHQLTWSFFLSAVIQLVQVSLDYSTGLQL